MKTYKKIKINGKLTLAPTTYLVNHTLWIDGKEPKYTYFPSEWSGYGGRYKLISEASSELYLPRDCNLVSIENVITILKNDCKDQQQQCWILTPHSGASDKCTLGNRWVDLKYNIHANTDRSLKIAVNKHRRAKIAQYRAQKLRRLDDSQIDKMIRNNHNSISPFKVSRSVGNCVEGTMAFLNKLGVDKNRTAKAGAIYRLAKIKKIETNNMFKRAYLSLL